MRMTENEPRFEYWSTTFFIEDLSVDDTTSITSNLTFEGSRLIDWTNWALVFGGVVDESITNSHHSQRSKDHHFDNH
jgi:hypothetical protein